MVIKRIVKHIPCQSVPIMSRATLFKTVGKWHALHLHAKNLVIMEQIKNRTNTNQLGVATLWEVKRMSRKI